MDYRDRGPLVAVQIAPNRWVKMYEKDAIAKGLVERKQMPQVGNKMIIPGGEKDVPVSKSSQPQAPTDITSSVPEAHEVEEDTAEADVEMDFTVMKGIGNAANEALHAHGIHQFAELLVADVSFLNSKAQAAIEAWRADPEV